MLMAYSMLIEKKHTLHCSDPSKAIWRENVHLSNVLTDHLNILAYIKAWLLPNNKIQLLLLYYTMTWKIYYGRYSTNYDNIRAV